MSFHQRHRQAEVMDQPDLDPTRHAAALQGLARINALSGSARILWPPLARLARRIGSRPVRILDVATGAGDVPLRLWRRAQRAGLRMVLEGCDISPVAIEHARAAAEQAGADLRFFVHDALAGPPATDYDAALCSLFLHHLGEDQAITLLRNMALAAPLVIVHDLQRGRLGWLLAWLGTRVLSRSEVVHNDGPISVAAAFTAEEARGLAERAGLKDIEVSRHWPCRFRLLARRP